MNTAQCPTCNKDNVCKYKESHKCAVDKVNNLGLQFPSVASISCKEYAPKFTGGIVRKTEPFSPWTAIATDCISKTVTVDSTPDSKELIWNSDDFTSD